MADKKQRGKRHSILHTFSIIQIEKISLRKKFVRVVRNASNNKMHGTPILQQFYDECYILEMNISK